MHSRSTKQDASNDKIRQNDWNMLSLGGVSREAFTCKARHVEKEILYFH